MKYVFWVMCKGLEVIHDVTRCRRPPVGWWCSRSLGHSGPCAARAHISVVQDKHDL